MNGKGLAAAFLCGALAVGLSAVDAWADDLGVMVEYRKDPVGIDTPRPRFSWHQVRGGQIAYRILVASSAELVAQDKGDLWDSGEIASAESVGIEYAGRPLKTGERAWWKVLSRGRDASAWSDTGRFVMGVMRPEDWSAKWIAGNPQTRPSLETLPAEWIGSRTRDELVLRKSFVWSGGGDGSDDFAFVSTEPADICINGRTVRHFTGHVFDYRALRFCHLTRFLRVGTNELTVVFKPKKHWSRPDARVPASAQAIWGVLRLGDGVQFPTDASWGGASFGTARQPDWSARVDFGEELCAPAFSRTFRIARPVRRATVFVTGAGYYELSLDGRKVGDKVLDPAPTDYSRRVLYSTYELDGLLAPGEHELKLVVGHGWYDMLSIGTWNWDAAPWRGAPRAILQMDVEYVDGSSERLVSDGRWRQVRSPVGYDSPREGEIVGGGDARAPDLEKTVVPAAEVDGPAGRLTAEAQPGSEIVETVRPSRVVAVSNGTYCIEFPQNLAGWIRFSARGLRAGEVVTIRYDERNPLRGTDAFVRKIDELFESPASHHVVARGDAGFQTDRLVGGGTGNDVYEPRFKYHGFAYVTIDGVRDPSWLSSVEACGIQTAFETTGSFACSDADLTALVRATERSYRCNFANGFPTDCPHREQNGWTGDASIASEFAQYAFENTAGYEKWLRDIGDAQRTSGEIPSIIPTSGWGYRWGNGPAWDSALPVIAWNLWRYRRDRRIVDETYPLLCRLNAHTLAKARGGLVCFGLGDWCPRDEKHMPSLEYVASCYHLQALSVAGAMARVRGCGAEADEWSRKAAAVRTALREKYRKDGGVWDNGLQTAEAMALAFGLCEGEDERRQTAERLVAACQATDYLPDVGIQGAKHMFRVLGEIGRFDVAVRMMTHPGKDTFVDWLRLGKGTLWENWDGRSSLNHIMFGDFAACLYQYAAGIRLPGASACALPDVARTAESADVLIAPQFVPTLSWVKASVGTPRGTVESDWRRTGGDIELNVSVPEGMTAEVVLPSGETHRVSGGRHSFVVRGTQAPEEPLDRFYREHAGKAVRRLPVSVLPENAFHGYYNAHFAEPDDRTMTEGPCAEFEAGTWNMVTLTLRCMPDLSDEITQSRIRGYVERAHRHGVKVFVDTDPRIARREFLRRWPKERQQVMRFESVPARADGIARCLVRFPAYGDHMSLNARAYDATDGRLVRAWAVTAGPDGRIDPKRLRDVMASVACEVLDADKPRDRWLVCSTDAVKPGETLCVQVAFDLFSCDVFSPHLVPFARELMQRYKALGADGGMRDEWGFPPNVLKDFQEHRSFWTSPNYEAAYAARTGGRSLTDDFLLLAFDVAGREGERRLAIDAYMRLNYERNTEIERDFCETDRRLFGDDVHVCKHPTWFPKIDWHEYLHNGLDWWSAPRGWAQGDEVTPVPALCGMAKKFGGPNWLNEGYQDDSLKYAPLVWRYALAGGRMVYHPVYNPSDRVRAKLDRPGLSSVEKWHCLHTDILADGALEAQCRVRLLNLVSDAPIDCPVAVIFGHGRVGNWADPAWNDWGYAIAYGIWRMNYGTDVYPSSELEGGTFRIDEDGCLSVGKQRYLAVVLNRFSPEDVSRFNRLVAGRNLRTRVFVRDTAGVPNAQEILSADGQEVALELSRLRATRQTPIRSGALPDVSEWTAVLPEEADGTLRLTDGTAVRIKAQENPAAGDPISGELAFGPDGGTVRVAFEAEGLFAARLGSDGKVEAIAGGALRCVRGPGLSIDLSVPEDIVLVRRGDRWHGVLQTKRASDEIRGELKALASEWTVLVRP